MAAIKNTTVNILGSKWRVEFHIEADDKLLDGSGGYCDWSIKTIVAETPDDTVELKDVPRYVNRILRHEIVHAFLYESGLGYDFEHPRIGHEETMIDWFARQSPKIYEVYKRLDCLE